MDKEIEKLYGAQLEQNKAQLESNYTSAMQGLDTQAQNVQKQAQDRINQTAVEADIARKNYAEVQNAYGLSSGAMAQAKLAQTNQLSADIAAIRAAQQETESGIELERENLRRQYENAIRQAQADNDMAKAQALYQEAARVDADLEAKKQHAAQLLANAGDYSLMQEYLNLTDDQAALLKKKATSSSKSSSSSNNAKTDEGKTGYDEETMSAYTERLKALIQGGNKEAVLAFYEQGKPFMSDKQRLQIEMILWGAGY